MIVSDAVSLQKLIVFITSFADLVSSLFSSSITCIFLNNVLFVTSSNSSSLNSVSGYLCICFP